MSEETNRESDQKGHREYPVEGFSRVDLSTAVEFEITQGSGYSVKAEGPERLVKRLKVDVYDDKLKVRLGTGSIPFPGFHSRGSVRVVITMPALAELEVSGACKGTAKGFRSSDDFELELSGASQAEIDIETGRAFLSVSGAGRLTGELKSTSTELELSGASRCELSGSGGDIELDFSGASRGDLHRFQAKNAEVDLSGASSAKITMDGTLDADLAGASSLDYSGNVTLGKTETSGASSLHGDRK